MLFLTYVLIIGALKKNGYDLNSPIPTSLEKNVYTEEEYFLREEQASYKSEFLKGKIIAMAGGSSAHDAICVNLYGALFNGLKEGNCRLFSSNMKLGIPAKGKYYYPDAMVACGKAQFKAGRDDTLENPTVVFEVLSQSTAELDRGEKLRDYVSLPSVQEYVLIDQYELRVEVYHRISPWEWKYQVFEGESPTIPLDSISVILSFEALYKHVVFDKP